MSDIRSFFGGGKPPPKASTPDATGAAAVTSSTKRKQNALLPEDNLQDSDTEEPQKRHLTRLKSGSQTELSPSSKKRVAGSTTPSKIDSVERSIKSPRLAAAAAAAAAVVAPSISSPAKKSPFKELKMETPTKQVAVVKKEAASTSKSATTLHSPPTPVGSNSLPLNGKKFVVSGIFAMGRERIEEIILINGGKVSSAISGKTDFLVAGHQLEDGRAVTESSKYRNAQEKKIKIMNEDEFLKLLDDTGISQQKVILKPSTVIRIPFVASMKPQDVAVTDSATSAPPCRAVNGHIETAMWVDKYKPSKLEDVIGCGDIIKKLLDWLAKWESVHIKKIDKIPFSKENPGAKAVLLSGPPGIGKTTVSSLVAIRLGYEVLEMNASDTRNKKAITEEVADVVLSRAMASDGSVKKRLVIMDEVDGMGGSDRGGVAELIKVIKSSMSPIICICNDRQSMKIKSLANHCFDLRMRRPTKMMIAQRIISLAKLEGLNMEPNAAEALAEQAGNDIRQTIHATQMWRAQSNTMKYADLKENMHRIEKDKILRQTPFDACGQILGGGRPSVEGASSFSDRYNSFFIDYSLVPLLVQQNYIDSSRNGIFKMMNLDDSQKLEKLAAAADAISDMELAESGIRGNDMHWELLPTMAALAVKAGCVVQGFQGYPTFPQWLGKNSSTGKSRRLTQELVHHTSLSIGQGFLPIRLDYVPYLRSHLLNLLAKSGADGAEEVVNMLDAYGLSKEDFSESLKELQLVSEKDPQLKDRYEELDSKVKTALTKLYNAMDHRSQALVSSQGVSKKKRGGGGGEGLLNKGDDDDIDDEEDDDEENKVEKADVGDVAAFIKANKKATAGAAKKTSNSGGGGKKKK